MIVILAADCETGRDACELHCKRVHGLNIFCLCTLFHRNTDKTTSIVDGRRDQIMTRYT